MIGGFQWKREHLGDKIDPIVIPPPTIKPVKIPYVPAKVDQINPETGEIIETWETVSLAAKTLGLQQSGIRISDKDTYVKPTEVKRRCGGFYWRIHPKSQETS